MTTVRFMCALGSVFVGLAVVVAVMASERGDSVAFLSVAGGLYFGTALVLHDRQPRAKR